MFNDVIIYILLLLLLLLLLTLLLLLLLLLLTIIITILLLIILVLRSHLSVPVRVASACNHSEGLSGFAKTKVLRPISLLTLWISEDLTRA